MATNRSVNIYISADPKGELNKLNKELAKNKEALDSLGKSGTKCTKEMDRLEKESVELSKKIGDLNKGLKLNDLTISQLSDRQTAFVLGSSNIGIAHIHPHLDKARKQPLCSVRRILFFENT